MQVTKDACLDKRVHEGHCYVEPLDSPVIVLLPSLTKRYLCPTSESWLLQVIDLSGFLLYCGCHCPIPRAPSAVRQSWRFHYLPKVVVRLQRDHLRHGVPSASYACHIAIPSNLKNKACFCQGWREHDRRYQACLRLHFFRTQFIVSVGPCLP